MKTGFPKCVCVCPLWQAWLTAAAAAGARGVCNKHKLLGTSWPLTSNDAFWPRPPPPTTPSTRRAIETEGRLPEKQPAPVYVLPRWGEKTSFCDLLSFWRAFLLLDIYNILSYFLFVLQWGCLNYNNLTKNTKYSRIVIILWISLIHKKINGASN